MKWRLEEEDKQHHNERSCDSHSARANSTTRYHTTEQRDSENSKMTSVPLLHCPRLIHRRALFEEVLTPGATPTAAACMGRYVCG